MLPDEHAFWAKNSGAYNVALVVALECVWGARSRARYGGDNMAPHLRQYSPPPLPPDECALYFHCDHCALSDVRRAYDSCAAVSPDEYEGFLADFAKRVSNAMPAAMMRARLLPVGTTKRLR